MAAQKIIDCLSKLANGALKTNRMDLKKLREVLDDDRNRLIIDQGSSNKSTDDLSWHRVFACSHEFLQECINCGKTSPTAINLRNDALKLLSQVVASANRDVQHPYLKYSETAEMLMYGAKAELSKDICVDFYICLLHDKLVALPSYWTELTTEQWDDLVDFCVKMYDEVPNSTAKLKLIKILDISIRIGSKQSMVVLNLRNKFKFFETILENADELSSKQHLAQEVLDMNISLATELAMECRFALCKLGESIMPIILNHCKKDLSRLTKYCIIQMALHHPYGALKGSSSAYAHDWEKWQGIMSHVFHLLQNELRACIESSKIRSKRNQEPTISSDLVILTVEIYKQLFSMGSEDISTIQANDSLSLTLTDGPSAKKAKLEIRIQMLIDQLKVAKRAEEICIRLIVLTTYLEKYGRTLSVKEYLSVLQMLAETRSLSKTSMVMTYFCQCCKSLLESVPHNSSPLLKEAENTCWPKIWDMALRSAGLNQCVESSNKLLQSMLQNKLVTAINVKNLLVLYVEKTIHLNGASLQTLIVLVATYHLPSMDSCPDVSASASQVSSQTETNWEHILSWLLPRKDDEDETNLSDLVSKVPPHLLGEACVRLICKNRAPLEKFGYPCYLNVADEEVVEKIHLAYGVVPQGPSNPPLPAHQPKPQLFKSGLDELSALLMDDSNQSRNQNSTLTSQKTCLQTLGAFVHKVIVNATVLSHLLEMKMLSLDNWKQFSITVETVHLLEVDIPDGFAKIISNSKESVYTLDQILLLYSLYSANFHVEVLQLIRDSSPQEYLEKLFKCCSERTTQIRSENSSSYISFVESSRHCPFPSAGTLTREDEKMVLFTKINSAFSFHPSLPLSGKALQHSKDVLRMCYDLINVNSPSSKQKILLVLKMASLATKYFDIDHSNFIMESLKDLTRIHQRDLLMVIPIMNILEGMLVFLHTFKHNTHKGFAQAIVKGFKVVIERNKRFGSQARLALISCIRKWVQLDPEQIWSKMKDVPAALELLDFAKDPYKEARLAVAECLPYVFKPYAPGWSFEQTLNWRDTVSKKVTQAVSESVLALEESNNKRDDNHNIGTSALKCLAETIVHCPEGRKKTLLTIFEALKKLNVDRTIIETNFQQIGSKLNCNFNSFLETNLRFLLDGWCSKLKIADFPFALLSCDSAKDFYAKFKNEVVVSLMLQNNLSEVELVAETLGTDVKSLTKDCKVVLFTTCLPLITNIEQLEPLTKMKLQNCLNLFQQFVDENEAEAILSDNFVDVISSLYFSLYDVADWQLKHSNELVMAIPDFVPIKQRDLRAAMRWIQRKLPDPRELVVYLANGFPEYTQMILQKMSLRVFGAATNEMKLLFFLQYSSLVEDLSNPLGENQLGPISDFFVNDVTLMHLNMLSEKCTEFLSGVICTSLYKLIVECCKFDSKLLELLFPKIVNTLVCSVKNNPGSHSNLKVMQVLNFIIIQEGNTFKEAISKLEQFPQEPEFAEIQAAFDHIRINNQDDHLETEITHFLNAGLHGHRVEGLQRLHKQLASRKEQLASLYLQLQGGNEFEAIKSCLRQLVSALLNLTKSLDEKIALEAAACLGELGPGQLLTTVLMEDSDKSKKESLNPIEQICVITVALLREYLTDSNSEVCILASEALHTLLRTKEGRTTLEIVPAPENLYPFKCGLASKAPFVHVNDVKFLSTMHEQDIWCPKSRTTHFAWISNLTSCILKNISFTKSYTEQLVRLCQLKEEFAEAILPPLILFVLAHEDCVEIVMQQLSYFFSCHFEKRTVPLKKKGGYVWGNQKSVECMLNVVHFLRINMSETMQHLNLLHVAQASQFCSAHFSCIYYAEMSGLNKKFLSGGRMRSIEQFCDDSENGRAMHENLFNSYKSIDESDAIYGCGMSRLLDQDSQERYLEHTKQWYKVLLMQDLNCAGPSAMSSALSNLGLHNLLRANLEAQVDNGMQDAQLLCCWRLGMWDKPTVLDLGLEENVSFESSRYSALKSLMLMDESGLQLSLNLAKKAVIDTLKQSNLESMRTVYDALAKLQMTQEILDISVGPLEDVLDKWQLQDEKSSCAFEHLEPIMEQRLCLLNLTQTSQFDMTDEGMRLMNAMADLLLKLSKIARAEKSFHVAERALNALTKTALTINKDVLHYKMVLEKANNHWDQGNYMFGKQLVVSMMEDLKTMRNGKTPDFGQLKIIQAIAMRTYGSWLVETGLENSRAIINEYLLPAVTLFNENNTVLDASEKVETMRTVALFADAEYQRIVKCMNSPDFKAKEAHMRESAKVDTGKSKDRDILLAYNVNVKQSQIDKVEIDSINSEKSFFLDLALQHYADCLCMSDERVSTVFRVISLILENKTAKVDLERIPSYKFIPVIPQLTPHLKTSKDSFQALISALLTRLAQDHPHHTLPHILTLKFAGLDHEFDDSVKLPANEGRIIEAQNLIKKLSKGSLQQIIKQMEAISNAIVQLAYHSHEGRRLTDVKIPDKLLIKKVLKFDKVQVATCSLPIQKSCKYQANGILRYDVNYSLVGGIHAPKKISCVSMDGEKHIQLCKGLDDLHLDAVMQQVFTIMNRMLLRNAGANKRKLHVRTYNVCPLSQRSGVIEWCKNTTPIGMYLHDSHLKYNPDDAQPKVCRAMMQECEKNFMQNKSKRIRQYMEICSSFRPVFHNFFLEYFTLPAEWFVRRLAYTRSVATSSMIGYILGLGDRHVQNILIDTKTAEVIHIDFGICFEQALILRIPELVPFRLSRDIESGFGISGTEGVFKKSCETAMQVLRENQTTIQSILQVLLYNPMYVWSIPLSKNDNSRSGMKGDREGENRSADEANQLAERALLRLQQKLMGTEEGMANSVEGQVNRLIQNARDPQNLALMFCGWQPYF